MDGPWVVEEYYFLLESFWIVSQRRGSVILKLLLVGVEEELGADVGGKEGKQKREFWEGWL